GSGGPGRGGPSRGGPGRGGPGLGRLGRGRPAPPAPVPPGLAGLLARIAGCLSGLRRGGQRERRPGPRRGVRCGGSFAGTRGRGRRGHVWLRGYLGPPTTADTWLTRLRLG